jgi:hypothetical protein
MVAAFSCLVSVGCGTIFGSTSQLVPVVTDPPGAQIVDMPSGDSALSPAELLLSKREGHRIVISKPGYETVKFSLRREVRARWWILGAFTLGLSIAIDAMTGALVDLKPAELYVVLEPIE